MIRAALLVASIGAAACASAEGPRPALEDTGAEAAELLGEARAARWAGDDAAAARLLDRALAAAPSSPSSLRIEILRERGHVHTRLGDPEAALACYDAAVALGASDAWLCYARGVALHTLGDDSAAVAAFTAALGLDPAHVKSLQFRAEIAAQDERYEDALLDLTSALERVEAADPSALAEWGGRKRELQIEMLSRRASVLDALGLTERAHADRESARRLAEEPRIGTEAG